MITRCIITIFTLLLLSGCGPSEKKRAAESERSRIECLDKICENDVLPKYDMAHESLNKLNGEWYVGPRKYFPAGRNTLSFEWWNHKPVFTKEERTPEMQALAMEGKGYDFAIGVFLDSNHIPPSPRGYKLIELARANNWIESQMTIRPGLDALRMKHVMGPRGQFLDHVTYYVATELRGSDGLPPVATCNHEFANGSGGTGFLWHNGIWVSTRMNQKHCADWPEIYTEIDRILKQLKLVQ